MLMLVSTFSLAPLSSASAALPARLQRVEIRSLGNLTRVTFKLDREAPHTMVVLPEKLRLTFAAADAPRFRALRNYSDSNIGGVSIRQRGDAFQVNIALKHTSSRVRMVDSISRCVVAVDVGLPPKPGLRGIISGRERILSGTEKLIKEFYPPLYAVIPFMPTDKNHLQQQLAGEELQLFQRGEGFLYKEKATEAAEVFEYFLKKGSAVKALAYYRLGEAHYLLQRYDTALKSFIEGEKLWPDYLGKNPATQLYYADCVARNGNYVAGRRMLARLIAQSTDKVYAPLLLDCLGDIAARQGRDLEALNIYRTVARMFPGTKAESRALLKLADKKIFSVESGEYRKLVEEYQGIYNKPGDFALRDEALFKTALLESFYGPEEEALSVIAQYEKKYPKGIFAGVIRSMHEELLLPLYLKLYAAKDLKGLVMLAQNHSDFLARCFTDQAFVRRVSEACAAENMLSTETKLFVKLLDREWTAPSATHMYRRIVDNAVILGNLPLAEISANEFLKRYPKHGDARRMLEHLGGIAFVKNDLRGVARDLKWLLSNKEKAVFPESYYYLGKSLAVTSDYKGAQKAMMSFIGEKKAQGQGITFLPDAFLVLAQCKKALNDYSGAMAAYKSGLEVATGETSHQFLYMMGELAQQQQKRVEARDFWQRVLTEGSDSVWRKMAQQSLNDLSWDEKISGMENRLSK
jgi:tetratricopeptide (TPR) repeat protein